MTLYWLHFNLTLIKGYLHKFESISLNSKLRLGNASKISKYAQI